jgi:hypothetical protein
MFVIEDELHAEWQEGQFETRQLAISELRRRAAIPWNEDPNRAPCTSWSTCGRQYVLIEYDGSTELTRELILEISPAGARWIVSE